MLKDSLVIEEVQLFRCPNIFAGKNPFNINFQYNIKNINLKIIDNNQNNKISKIPPFKVKCAIRKFKNKFSAKIVTNIPFTYYDAINKVIIDELQNLYYNKIFTFVKYVPKSNKCYYYKKSSCSCQRFVNKEEVFEFELTYSPYSKYRCFKINYRNCCLIFIGNLIRLSMDLNNQSIYAVDMMITGERMEINHAINIIKNNFKRSESEPINYILENNNYIISPIDFIEKLLKTSTFNIQEKQITSCVGDNKISENIKPFSMTTCESAIAKYTRPDIAFAVGKAFRNSEHPTISEWKKNFSESIDDRKIYLMKYIILIGEIILYLNNYYFVIKNKTPISLSNLKQQFEKYKLKINYNDNDNKYLFSACKNGNENIVKYLVELGANISKEDVNGATPLFYACENGNENLVKYLVEHGADIYKEDENGETSLFYTCQNGNENLVKYLVEHEANVNKVGCRSRTPLLYTCGNANVTVNAVKYLVEHEADVNREDGFGSSPLFYACERMNENMVKYLVEHGADINKENEKGETPLFYTCQSENENLVKYLVEHSADINIENEKGKYNLMKSCTTKTRNNNSEVYIIYHGEPLLLNREIGTINGCVK
ncbi:ankyrin repeat-containing domain protein [Neocallimastix sp. 'constans']